MGISDCLLQIFTFKHNHHHHHRHRHCQLNFHAPLELQDRHVRRTRDEEVLRGGHFLLALLAIQLD